MKRQSLLVKFVSYLLYFAFLLTGAAPYMGRGIAQEALPDTVPLGGIKLDQIDSDSWVAPPKPVSQRRAKARKRGAFSASHGVRLRNLPDAPTDIEIRRSSIFSEPLIPMSGSSTDVETASLSMAINDFRNRENPDDVSSLEGFIRANPESRWNASLLLNVGLIQYNTGWFSRALESWKASWEQSHSETAQERALIADRALAEFCLMNARIGRKEALKGLLDGVASKRLFQGTAALKIERAKEGYWTMCHRPEVAFCCGPYALGNLEPILKDRSASTEYLISKKSPPTGFSLTEVCGMADELDLGLQMAKRSPGSDVVLPAVVHWKVGHFGALIREADGRYLLKDPTFGNETWLSKACLDAESSGYFLIPERELPRGWSGVQESEGSTIYGKGHSGNGGEGETDGNSGTKGGCPGGEGYGMASYTFHILLASLSVSDQPVGYLPAYGPGMMTTVRFNQREYAQPTTMEFTHFGPQWVSNWISYLEDNPDNPATNVNLHQRGGGFERHTGFNAETGLYQLQPRSRVRLARVGDHVYERQYPDGSKEVYAHFIGTTGPSRRVFLSEIVDPQGNAVTLEYDSDPAYPARLRHIYDATGLVTDFSYEDERDPHRVTRIEDPFGRSAEFSYENTVAGVRLTKITDVIGIESEFRYNSEGNIDALTTPYGTTTFSLSPFKLGGAYTLHRFIEATDPQGDKERIEYNHDTNQTGVPNVLQEPTPDGSAIRFQSGDHDDRISFFWDKEAMHHIGGVVNDPSDYRAARWYRWVQPDSSDRATSILEDSKEPLEGRVWYNYPNQPAANQRGDHNRPTAVGRLVEDEEGNLATQVWRMSYNELSNLTSFTDPLGRQTTIEYEENGIDIKRTLQKRGEEIDQLMSYNYHPDDPPRLPREVIDGSGQRTKLTYRPTGQVAALENARGEVVHYEYQLVEGENGFGRVKRIFGDVSELNFTYDEFDRVATIVDSEGLFISITYDELNRVTSIVYPDGSYEQIVYERLDMAAYRDRRGTWTRMYHNSIQELTGVLDPLGRLTQFDWCRCGDINKITDAVGNTTRWVRDVQGRVTHKYYPDGSFQCTNYDFSGRVENTTNRRGQPTDYRYHLDDTVAGIDYQDPATPDVLYQWDPDYLRITERVDGIGAWKFDYHPYDGQTLGAGLLKFEDGPFLDDTKLYAYDPIGNLLSSQIVDDATQTISSRSETYGYDRLDRLATIENNLGKFTNTYVGLTDRLSKVSYPNDIETEFSYADISGDHYLSSMKNIAPDGSLISQFDYTRTDDRQIKTWKQTYGPDLETETGYFSYDQANQLVEARLSKGSETTRSFFGYDPAQNQTSLTTNETSSNSRFNQLNQLTSKGSNIGHLLVTGLLDEPAKVMVNDTLADTYSDAEGFHFRKSVALAEGESISITAEDGSGNISERSYTLADSYSDNIQNYEYDTSGNLVLERGSDGEVLREFGWDQKNRLISIVEGERVTRMAYDGLDRRIYIEDAVNGEVERSDWFVWCHGSIAQKRSGNRDVVTMSYFLHGLERADGETRYYTFDHLGSIRELMSLRGEIVGRNKFSPFGVQTSEGERSEFGFTGQYDHASSRLLLFQYRAYDSFNKRWLSADPLEIVSGSPAEILQGSNLYRYSFNDPINLVDDDGLYAPLWWLGQAIARGAASVAEGYIIAKITGGCYGWGDAGSDFLLGATGGKLLKGAGKAMANMVPAPKIPKAFPNLTRTKPKTSVQGGGGLRKRWKDKKGNIYEWDSQHGTVEMYNKRGKHLGEFDADTGDLLKGAVQGRTVEP